MKVLSAFPGQVLFKGLNQPSETAEGHSSPRPLSTPRAWGFFPKVYIDEPTSFPVRLQKKTCSMLLEVLQKHCVISDQHKTCCNEKTPSPERENFLTMVLIPRREKHPFSGWQHGRDFNSGPNSLRHLKKLYSVYGCGRKKSPHLSNWSSAAQSKRTSTTNNCVSKYKHKNTVLWHVMCAWILPLIVLPHSWCKANVPQAPLGLSVLVIPVVQSVQERDGAELLSVILHFRALTGPENMA